MRDSTVHGFFLITKNGIFSSLSVGRIHWQICVKCTVTLILEDGDFILPSRPFQTVSFHAFKTI